MLKTASFRSTLKKINKLLKIVLCTLFNQPFRLANVNARFANLHEITLKLLVDTSSSEYVIVDEPSFSSIFVRTEPS